MTPASNPRTSPILDTVVGRLLEWMVNSVEDLRARWYRGHVR